MEIVKVLIYFKACDVNKCPYKHGYPLHVAIRKWNTAEVNEVLIDAGADVNAVVSDKTPLIEALRKSKVNKTVVKRLIDAGASVNFQTSSGHCPVHFVAGNTNISKECATALLKAGADPNITHENVFPPLVIAVYADNYKIADVLLQHGADVNGGKMSFTPPLILAVQYGFEEIIKLLLRNHANVNDENCTGESALQSAVVANNLAVTKLLRKQNCNMENKSLSMIREVPESQHPLVIALTRGNDKIVKLLPEFSTIVKHLSAVMQHDNDLVQWVYDFSHNPRTLLHICRVYIRKRYGTRLFRTLEILCDEKRLPPRLSDLIFLKDLLT